MEHIYTCLCKIIKTAKLLATYPENDAEIPSSFNNQTLHSFIRGTQGVRLQGKAAQETTAAAVRNYSCYALHAQCVYCCQTKHFSPKTSLKHLDATFRNRKQGCKRMPGIYIQCCLATPNLTPSQPITRNKLKGQAKTIGKPCVEISCALVQLELQYCQ